MGERDWPGGLQGKDSPPAEIANMEKENCKKEEKESKGGKNSELGENFEGETLGERGGGVRGLEGSENGVVSNEVGSGTYSWVARGPVLKEGPGGERNDVISGNQKFVSCWNTGRGEKTGGEKERLRRWEPRSRRKEKRVLKSRV